MQEPTKILEVSESPPFQTIEIPSRTLAYFADLAAFKEELDLAIEALAYLRQNHVENTKLNVGAAYMSPWDSPKLTPKLYPLLRVVLRYIYAACKAQYLCDLKSLNFKFRAFQCWTAIYEHGDETTFHNHFPADYSSIVYLQMASGAAPIILEQQVECRVPSGSLIFFQGHVNHHVPKTEGVRSVMVANFYKLPVTVPTYQDPYFENL